MCIFSRGKSPGGNVRPVLTINHYRPNLKLLKLTLFMFVKATSIDVDFKRQRSHATSVLLGLGPVDLTDWLLRAS